jgi:acyl-coenzyme A thioesterase PaaI-like protein
MSIQDSAATTLDAATIDKLLDVRFPQIHANGRHYIEDVTPQFTRVRLKADVRNIRPGGTISGPAMFTMADFSVYVAIIGRLGESGIDAVTTNMNISFLAKPEAGDILCQVRLLRIGKRLAVAEAELTSCVTGKIVARAVATYALPAR